MRKVLIIDRMDSRREENAEAFRGLQDTKVFTISYSRSVADPDITGLRFDLVLRHGSDNYPDPKIEEEALFKVCYGGGEGVHRGIRKGEENIYRIIFGDSFLTPNEAEDLLQYVLELSDSRPNLLNADTFDQELEDKLNLVHYLAYATKMNEWPDLPHYLQHFKDQWGQAREVIEISDFSTKRDHLIELGTSLFKNE